MLQHCGSHGRSGDRIVMREDQRETQLRRVDVFKADTT